MSQPHETHPVATGDRREEKHYEPDGRDRVKIRHTFAPEDPLPAEEQSAASEAGTMGSLPGLTDVAVTRGSASVWDARPVEDSDDIER